MKNRTSPLYLYGVEYLVTKEIAKSRDISYMEAFKLLVHSETHEMLLNDDMKLWHLSHLAIFDIWENEVRTGEPRNSLYIRGDEIG